MFENRFSPDDYVPCTEVQAAVRDMHMNVTSRRYNRWLRAEGAETDARVTTGGRHVRVVRGLKRKLKYV